MDVAIKFQQVILACFTWLNTHGFIFAGIPFTFWNVFCGGAFISLAGVIIVNLVNTGKGY